MFENVKNTVNISLAIATLFCLTNTPIFADSAADQRFFENAEQYNDNEGLQAYDSGYRNAQPLNVVPEIEVATQARRDESISKESFKPKRRGLSFSDMANSTQKKTGSYGRSFSQMARSAKNKRSTMNFTITPNMQLRQEI